MRQSRTKIRKERKRKEKKRVGCSSCGRYSNIEAIGNLKTAPNGLYKYYVWKCPYCKNCNETNDSLIG